MILKISLETSHTVPSFEEKSGLVNQVEFVGIAGPFFTIVLATFKTIGDAPTQKCVK